jgi:hypothetical protein
MAFSPDGQRLAAGVSQLTTGNIAKVLVWDALTGQELLELPGPAISLVKSPSAPTDSAWPAPLVAPGVAKVPS